MGFIGDIIGGIGQEKAGDKAISQERFSQQQALTQLGAANAHAAADPYFTQSEDAGTAANTAQANLLGVGGDPAKQQAAFNNYLGSTGYQFQLKQGQNAVGSSAASKGLLNSGATAKALDKYGQGLASTSFNNYFGQLGQLSSAGAASATTRNNTSLGVANSAANTISQSGSNQAQYAQNAIAGQYNAYGNAANSLVSSFV